MAKLWIALLRQIFEASAQRGFIQSARACRAVPAVAQTPLISFSATLVRYSGRFPVSRIARLTSSTRPAPPADIHIGTPSP